VVEKEFNFGDVRFGNRKTLPLTIQNDSKIEANILIDLRKRNQFDEVGCLQIDYIKNVEDNEDAFMLIDKHPDETEKQ